MLNDPWAAALGHPTTQMNSHTSSIAESPELRCTSDFDLSQSAFLSMGSRALFVFGFRVFVAGIGQSVLDWFPVVYILRSRYEAFL